MKKILITIGIVFAALTYFRVNALFPVAAAQTVPVNASADVEITPQALATGAIGSPYSQSIAVTTNSTGPFYWTVSNLPNGLSANTQSNGSNIVISGTPTSNGTSIITVNVTNHIVAATVMYYLTIGQGGIINTSSSTTLTSPSSTIATSTSTSTVNVAETSTSTTESEIESLTQQLQQLESEIANQTSTQQGEVLGTSIGPITSSSPQFYRDLSVGDTGPDVFALQQFLNDMGYTIATSGPGSRGNETDYFGPRTAAALMRWQSALGVYPANGYFGVSSRNTINELASDL